MTDNISITIKNFKSYKDATLPLAPLTLLIGANASGKSNAIEAFRFLSWVAGGERLSTLKNRVNDSDKIIRGTINDLAFNKERQFLISIDISHNFSYELICEIEDNILKIANETVFSFGQFIFFTDKDCQKTYSNLSKYKNIGSFNLKKFYQRKDSSSVLASYTGTNKLVFKIGSSDGSKLKTFSEYNDLFMDRNYDSDPVSNYKFILVDNKFLKENPIITLGFIKEINYFNMKKTYAAYEYFFDFLEKIDDTYFFDFVPTQMRNESLSEKDLRQNGQNLAGVLHYLCAKSEHTNENKAKLLNLIKSLPEQNIIDIKFYIDHRERVEFALVENFGDTPKEFPMDLLSDGTLKVLAIATALLSVPVGSTLVIEEIDNSIHPSRAHEILSLIRQYAEERGLKLLLSTHNPALMDAIPDEALADVVFCYRDPKEGDSRLVRLGDLDDFVGLVVQGSLGDLVTQGVVERFVKHPTTSEQKKQQALDWLKQMQADDV